MAVPEQTPFIEYTANGATTVFPLTFDCDKSEYLIVSLDGEEAPVGSWALTNGSVAFNTAPSNGVLITIERNTPFRRTTEYQSYNNSFRPSAVNKDFDLIWWKLQELGVTDWLLRLYINRLHGEQKTYIDQKDTQLQNNINSLSTHVDKQDAQLQQNIDNLKTYVDDKDNELRAYLMEEIRKQGVALDQLDDYYNYLMQRLAQIAVQGGWEASFVVDASGKNQQVINNNTAYFYHTVLAMIADESLTDGKVVATKGYHNIFDDGGAIYLISSVATDYSIPLANGLHAVFRDTFDIRKFGIRDNETLDQTEYLQRMVAYADTRVYEIDFHNYSIMTPKTITHVRTGNPQGIGIQGLAFRHTHHIKNLSISNDKSVQLQKRTVNILFCPDDDVDTPQTFKLSNIVFDPYVENHVPYSGVDFYDGCIHGFMAHPSATSTLDSTMVYATNYSFEFENIHFQSPAYSYNITTSAVFSRSVKMKSLTGDYLALYYNFHSYNLEINDLHGTYRDDMLENGRNVVKTLVHYEPELRGHPSAAYGEWRMSNLSVKRKSDGKEWWAFKVHQYGDGHFIKKIDFSSIVGTIHFYATSPLSSTIESLVVSNSSNELILGNINFTSVKLINFTLTSGTVGGFMLDSTNINELVLEDCTIRKQMAVIQSPVFNVNSLIANGLTVVTPSGIIRHPTAKIANIEIGGIKFKNITTSESKRLIEVDYDSLFIDGLNDLTPFNMSNFIYKIGETKAKTTLLNIHTRSPQEAWTYFVLGKTDVNIENSSFLTKPVFSLTDGVVTHINTPQLVPTGSKTFDPPSIAAGSSTTTTVTVVGVTVGSMIQASFSQYNADIEISAVVSAANTATVKFKNTGAAAVDLPGGTITVKLI
ncbi:hypothetical protein [Acinetobacter baumannii]|uniref:hypothetical protein n=1 Tax=Acinetobacter baumannii TaxID=470 RepID=UPI00280F127A|nr:hypothetical protein [Acinetobacter baumannii]MDQ8959178.1 hypothetical protein [Acinetobacter baumannii]